MMNKQWIQTNLNKKNWPAKECFKKPKKDGVVLSSFFEVVDLNFVLLKVSLVHFLTNFYANLKLRLTTDYSKD